MGFGAAPDMVVAWAAWGIGALRVLWVRPGGVVQTLRSAAMPGNRPDAVVLSSP